MTSNARSFTLALLLSLALAQQSPDTCFWRSHNNIVTQTSGWVACNNTQINPGGAQLCCFGIEQCGEDSICHQSTSSGGSGYYVGGCTDGSYLDPVCRTSCTGDYQTWIQYNTTEQLWHCCGDSGCLGTPRSETFAAVAPGQWSVLPSLQASAFAATANGTAATVTAIVTASPGGLGTVAVAGIAVLAVVAGLALVGMLAFCLLWRRAKAARRNADQDVQRQREEMQQQYQDSTVAPHFASGGEQYCSAPAGSIPSHGGSPNKPPAFTSLPRMELGDDRLGELADTNTRT